MVIPLECLHADRRKNILELHFSRLFAPGCLRCATSRYQTNILIRIYYEKDYYIKSNFICRADIFINRQVFSVGNSNLFSTSNIDKSSYLVIFIALCISAAWVFSLYLKGTKAKKLLEERALELAVITSHLDAISLKTTDAIFTADSDGLITSYNSAGENIFGYHSQEIIGSRITEFLPYSTLDKQAGGEVDGRRKDGRMFPVTLSLNKFKIADETYFTGIARDVSDSKQAEKEIYKTAGHL